MVPGDIMYRVKPIKNSDGLPMVDEWKSEKKIIEIYEDAEKILQQFHKQNDDFQKTKTSQSESKFGWQPLD